MGRRRYYNNRPTKVFLHWDSNIGAYSFKFNDTFHWDQMQGVLTWVKQTFIIAVERDYDPDTKTWFLKDMHIKELKMLLENIREFTLDFIEKPDDAYVPNFVPMDQYLNTFKEITGHDINTATSSTAGSNGYDDAKKAYRKACFRYHPDRNPDNPDCARKISALNEAWLNLETRHFKTKEIHKQEAA